MSKDRIKFTTRDAALKDGTLYNELNRFVMPNGTDEDDIFDKIVSIASIIKTFTKNVEIDVGHSEVFRKEVFHGEAWFYMKNATNEECFNNATAYKVLVNLIDPSIKVSAFLWPNDANGTGDDVIDVNFFGYTLNTGNSEQDVKAWTSSGLKAKQVMREEQAMKEGRKLARSEAELWLNEAYERLHKEVIAKESIEATGSYSGLDVDDMERWSSDEDDDDIDLWSADEDE